MSAPIFPIEHVTVGIALEPSFGTPTAPTYYLPILKPTAADLHGVVPDQGWRGPAGDSFGHAPGTLEGAVTLGGDVFADTIGFPLAGVLGDVAVSGSGPVTTVIAMQNGAAAPPSYTITTTDPINTRQWPGGKFSAVTLSALANGALTWTAALSTLASNTASAPSTAYTSLRIFPAWLSVVQIGGTTVSTVIDSKVTISRKLTPKRNVDGSQAPHVIHSGICAASGTLTLLLTTDAYRLLYVAGTSTSIDLNYAQGAGSTATQVRIHCSDVILTSVVPDYASGPWQMVKIDWVADYNTTDVGASGGWSPVKVTLKNAVGAGTYA